MSAIEHLKNIVKVLLFIIGKQFGLGVYSLYTSGTQMNQLKERDSCVYEFLDNISNDYLLSLRLTLEQCNKQEVPIKAFWKGLDKECDKNDQKNNCNRQALVGEDIQLIFPQNEKLCAKYGNQAAYSFLNDYNSTCAKNQKTCGNMKSPETVLCTDPKNECPLYSISNEQQNGQTTGSIYSYANKFRIYFDKGGKNTKNMPITQLTIHTSEITNVVANLEDEITCEGIDSDLPLYWQNTGIVTSKEDLFKENLTEQTLKEIKKEDYYSFTLKEGVFLYYRSLFKTDLVDKTKVIKNLKSAMGEYGHLSYLYKVSFYLQLVQTIFSTIGEVGNYLMLWNIAQHNEEGKIAGQNLNRLFSALEFVMSIPVLVFAVKTFEVSVEQLEALESLYISPNADLIVLNTMESLREEMSNSTDDSVVNIVFGAECIFKFTVLMIYLLISNLCK